ncbi:unnamed protein product [Protopolystoma xenopodis]|uniref:Uncharacterized protein n=1 Tax=Protopolystoma xenopodis TaxID=117903 RepID=A0A3S5AWP3_9PLAT|nr:unnamed protein product [Protopolystoma xenopodis]
MVFDANGISRFQLFSLNSLKEPGIADLLRLLSDSYLYRFDRMSGCLTWLLTRAKKQEVESARVEQLRTDLADELAWTNVSVLPTEKSECRASLFNKNVDVNLARKFISRDTFPESINEKLYRFNLLVAN